MAKAKAKTSSKGDESVVKKTNRSKASTESTTAVVEPNKRKPRDLLMAEKARSVNLKYSHYRILEALNRADGVDDSDKTLRFTYLDIKKMTGVYSALFHILDPERAGSLVESGLVKRTTYKPCDSRSSPYLFNITDKGKKLIAKSVNYVS